MRRALPILFLAAFAVRSGVAAESAVRPGHLLLTGRVVAADGATPADFAAILSDCKRVACRTAADGTLRCEMAPPADGYICLEHPRLGRKRIDLEKRQGNVPLGVVQLVEGGTIRIVKPLHVELPSNATIALLRAGEEIVPPRPVGSRETMELEGVKPGKYDVLLAGEGPLQRKLFPVEVVDRGEVEVSLSLDAYKLTSVIEYQKKPFASATVFLQEAAWTAEFETDQSGRFEAELWAPGDYAVRIESARLTQPYLLMKSASVADSDWRVTVPARRINGKVYDAETGRAVAGVTLEVETDDQTTRAKRRLDVGDDGTFTLTGAGDGHYRFSASAPGYLPSEVVPLDVAEGDGDPNVTVAMVRGIPVPVSVVDVRGQAIAEALVLTDVSDAEVRGFVRTDAAGLATVAVADRSSKSIFVLPRKGSFAIARLDAERDKGGARVVVPDGAATLTIETTIADGEPVPGVGFALRYAGMDVPAGVLRQFAAMHQLPMFTDARGTLRVSALPPGSYEIAWRQRGKTAVLPGGWTSVNLGAGETLLTQTFSKTQAP